MPESRKKIPITATETFWTDLIIALKRSNDSELAHVLEDKYNDALTNPETNIQSEPVNEWNYQSEYAGS